MQTVYLIPTSPVQQTFSISLNGISYTMRFYFCDDPSAGWILDIGDASGLAIVCGLPIKSGVNLLGQLNYLGFGGGLVVILSGNIVTVGYADLGVNAQLYYYQVI